METIIFTSMLGTEYLNQLEKLLFFNQNQQAVRAEIVGAVERYGAPEVVKENGRLRVQLKGPEPAQSLFAIEGRALVRRLIGAMVYCRADAERLALLHLAVRKDYAAGGKNARHLLALRLIGKLREIARQIRGIKAISVFYGDREPWLIPVPQTERSG